MTRAETAVLDAAKQAIKGGDPAGALRILNQYDIAFAHGELEQEASMLRIEALARAGRRPEASDRLKAFRASYPDSPHLEMLTGIVGE
jgi:outer membrane protein assembly factor BamD (BamD/ComL family)